MIQAIKDLQNLIGFEDSAFTVISALNAVVHRLEDSGPWPFRINSIPKTSCSLSFLEYLLSFYKKREQVKTTKLPVLVTR